MFNPRPMTFEEWKIANPDLANQAKEECEECHGDGEIECECCGHTNDCLECNGNGWIDVAEELYERMKREDLKKLEKFVSLSQ